MSDERLKQEGYWFWQEFIAEAISKFVSYKHRSSFPLNYHPDLIDWHPDVWGAIPNRLLDLLEDTLYYHDATIDEYSLAHYFANLLMDDFTILYIKASIEGKLKIYNGENVVIAKPNEFEPTCISDMPEEGFREPLWKMKDLLEKQLSKEDFWLIDEAVLLQIGKCIGDMMFEKIILLSKAN